MRPSDKRAAVENRHVLFHWLFFAARVSPSHRTAGVGGELKRRSKYLLGAAPHQTSHCVVATYSLPPCCIKE